MDKGGIALFGISLMTIFNFNFISASGGHAGVIIPWLEWIILFFMAVSIFLNLKIISNLKNNALRVPMIFMLVGVFSMTLARVFILLFEYEFYHIGNETLATWWHLFFYLGMTCFLIMLSKLDNLKDSKEFREVGIRDGIILAVLGILFVSFFFSAHPFNIWFSSWYEGTLMAEIGLTHFIAFVFVSFVAVRLFLLSFSFSEKTPSKLIKKINPLFFGFFLFLFLMSANHFWELITESWGFLLVSEKIIETVEQLFWLPGSLFLAYGLWRAWNEIKK